jgi:uncharacterized protein (TIGR03066 family)
MPPVAQWRAFTPNWPFFGEDMAHIPDGRLVWLWLVLLAGLLMLHPCKADSPSRQEGQFTGEKMTDKIVGRWQMVAFNGCRDFPYSFSAFQFIRIATFTKDSKYTLTIYRRPKWEVAYSERGAYKVDGKKLTIKKEGKKDEIQTIKTLDDKKLVTVDSKGREAEFDKGE